MALDFDSLQKPFRKLPKALKKLPDSPPPEAVHKLRTRMRTAEATVKAFMLDQQPDGKRLLEALKPARRAAGEVRDMDVLVGFGSSLAGDSENECLVELLEYLGSHRTKAAGELQKTVAANQKEIRRGLQRCSRTIEKEFHSSNGSVASSARLSTNAMALSLQLETELAAWPKLNAENIHPYRIKVKELRNVLRLARGDDSEFIQALGEVKDRIGEWHDWYELAAVADKALDHGSTCEITKQIKLRVRKEFEKALSVANGMRRQYLQGDLNGGSAKKRSPVQLKPAVVKATARLAG